MHRRQWLWAALAAVCLLAFVACGATEGDDGYLAATRAAAREVNEHSNLGEYALLEKGRDEAKVDAARSAGTLMSEEPPMVMDYTDNQFGNSFSGVSQIDTQVWAHQNTFPDGGEVLVIDIQIQGHNDTAAHVLGVAPGMEMGQAVLTLEGWGYARIPAAHRFQDSYAQRGKTLCVVAKDGVGIWLVADEEQVLESVQVVVYDTRGAPYRNHLLDPARGAIDLFLARFYSPYISAAELVMCLVPLVCTAVYGMWLALKQRRLSPLLVLPLVSGWLPGLVLLRLWGPVRLGRPLSRYFLLVLALLVACLVCLALAVRKAKRGKRT